MDWDCVLQILKEFKVIATELRPYKKRYQLRYALCMSVCFETHCMKTNFGTSGPCLEQRMSVKWFIWVLRICPKSILTSLFQGRWPAPSASSRWCTMRKYFTSNLCQGLQSRILVHVVWSWYLTWAIRKWKSSMQKICSRTIHMYLVFRQMFAKLWFGVVLCRATRA